MGKWVLTLCRDAIGVFYSPSRLGHRTPVEGVFLLCRDAVGLFYSPSRLGHWTLFGGVLLFCRDAVGLFYSPSRLGHWTLFGGVLLFCRDAVGLFYSPSRLGHWTLFGRVLLFCRGLFCSLNRLSYPGHFLAKWVLTLCRDAIGIFQSPSRLGHRTLVEGVLLLCRDAVGLFYSLNRLGHWTLVEGVLLFCENAVGLFYSRSRSRKATGHWLGEYYSSTETQSLYSPAPANRATRKLDGEVGLTSLQRCSRCILQPLGCIDLNTCLYLLRSKSLQKW